MATTFTTTTLYKAVSANDTEEDVYVPANNERVYLVEVGGSGCLCKTIKVEIFWGTEVLFATHGDQKVPLDRVLTGDGIKSIKILLTNDSSTTETIGCFYRIGK